ncbi:MAG: UDP-3-O-(3-hydroxymyristoyl)glucosamine N-acyltransferase [Chitinophagales bacterium]
MKLAEPLLLEEVARQSGARILGSAGGSVTGINEMHQTQPGDITFVDHPKYYDKALHSAATFLFINKEMTAPEGKVLLLVEDPFTAYNTLARRVAPGLLSNLQIHPSAQIHPSSFIGWNVFIGPNVVIGKNCVIHNQVSIGNHTQIGNGVIIHPGTTIGADAFYFKNRGTHFEKMHTVGRVVIGDNVEIGANCTIDAGVSADTVIGSGTKIDNLVQVAHDVTIGSNCLLCAQVGISGNSKIGNRVKLYGKVGVVQNITIADDVIVLGASNVGNDLEKGKTYLGSPCEEMRTTARQWAALKKLPDLLQRLYDKNP